MVQAFDPVIDSWVVAVNPTKPGEFLTVVAGSAKSLLVFSDATKAEAMLCGLSYAADFSLDVLDAWTMKDSYLTAARRTGAERVVFDYIPGAHSAMAAPLDRLLEALRPRR